MVAFVHGTGCGMAGDILAARVAVETKGREIHEPVLRVTSGDGTSDQFARRLTQAMHMDVDPSCNH